MTGLGQTRQQPTLARYPIHPQQWSSYPVVARTVGTWRKAAKWLAADPRPVWTAPLWQERIERFCNAGRCGHVFDLLMRRTSAAGHNAFRGIGSRPKTRARSALARVGFPVSRYRPAHCITLVPPF